MNQLKDQVDQLMDNVKLYEGGINNRTKIYYLNSGKMKIFETQRTSTPVHIWVSFIHLPKSTRTHT